MTICTRKDSFSGLGRRQRLLILYGVWAALLLVSSTWLLRLVTAQIGETYGGFVMMLDDSINPPYYVGPELWRTSPAFTDELRLFDHLLTIDGAPAGQFGEVFASLQPGDLVTYDIQRGDLHLVARHRAERFTFTRFLISHGLLYFTGVTYLLAGLILLWTTRRRDLTVMAFAFLPGAAAWLTHSAHTNISHPDVVHPAFDLLVWTPALPLAAAFLLHFAMVFPAPHGLAQQRPRLVYAPYIIAILLIVVYRWGRSLDGSALDYIALAVEVLFAAAAILSQLLTCARGYRLTRRKQDVASRKVVETVVVLWLVTMGAFVVIGLVPLVVLQMPLLPWEIWIALILMFPPVAVYALRNAEAAGQLQEEIGQRQRYADKVAELQDIREQTLHEVADALHDRVIPDLRGLHFAAVAAQRRLSPPADPALAGDLSFIADTLTALGDQARAIMEGAKPIDWRETGLQQALAWLVNSFQRANPHLTATLSTGGYDEGDAAATKEALYLIARAALTNVQEHAQAKRVSMTLASTPDSVSLRLSDDGAGFEAATTPPRTDRRHLGLGNMRLRAQEIGAELSVVSRSGFGTIVEVVAPRSAQD